MTDTTKQERGRPEPIRTCAGCGKRGPAEALLRVVLGPEGEVAVDMADSRFGRGAHVHPARDCVEKALKSGLSKAFKAQVPYTAASYDDFATQVHAAADRRIEGLLAGAKRARHAVFGADMVSEALAKEEALLVIVAVDAAAAARIAGVDRAVAEGRAIGWGDKARIGALFGKDEIAVCAVTNEGVASAIAATHRASRALVTETSRGPGSRSEAWWSPEVR